MKTNTLTSMALCALVLVSGRSLAAPANTQSILKALDENQARMVQAFVARDAGNFASCWTPNAICAVEELPLIRGREELSSVFLDAVGGASMHGLERLNRRLWMCGGYVYETGVYVHRFALTGREQVQSNAKNFVTVWVKQPDGSWLRTAEAWNNCPIPSADQLADWREQALQDIPFTVVDAPAADGADDVEKALGQLAGREQTFHRIFLTDDVGPAIDTYTDDVRYLSGESGWFVGKQQLRDWIMAGRKQMTLVGIECEVVARGGDGKMAFVVNRFHWQFKAAETGDQVHDFFGKGLHVWQRQSDGQWKIVIDINNTNPPPGENP